MIVVIACTNHFLLELTISKFSLEKQCSSKITLTCNAASDEV